MDMIETNLIEIDGSAGGGQLLRTALSLSLCTGTGFTMTKIRARRSKPGLMRQHLTAVNAAAKIGNAFVEGAELGATTLRFTPGVVTPGDYRFATGSAGSAMLVLQTVLPPLWRCDRASTLRLEGGTHNPMAPSADFLSDTFLPAVAKIGIEASLRIERPGFFPAGVACSGDGTGRNLAARPEVCARADFGNASVSSASAITSYAVSGSSSTARVTRSLKS